MITNNVTSPDLYMWCLNLRKIVLDLAQLAFGQLVVERVGASDCLAVPGLVAHCSCTYIAQRHGPFDPGILLHEVSLHQQGVIMRTQHHVFLN